MNLQAVSLSKAPVTSPNITTSTCGQSNAAKPVSRQFNHVLGSLIAADGKQPEQGTSKRPVSTQDVPPTPLDVTTPPANPIILPAILKFSLLLPASPKAKAKGSDISTTSEKDSPNQNELPQLASPQMTVQAAIPVPTLNNATSPTGVQESHADSSLGISAGEELPNSVKPQTALELVDPSRADKPRLEVNADETQPLSNADLALSAKITPLAGSVAETASTTVANPPSNTGPIHAVATVTPVPGTGNATGANQQPDTGGDGDPAQGSKQPIRFQAKAVATGNQATTDPPPAVSNQYSTQAPTMVTAAVPIAADLTPSTTQKTTKDQGDPIAPPVDARPKVAALPDTAVAPRAEPVRDLSIRIGNSAGNQVDVKIQERAGEVRVSVLSSNPGLTSDLRQQVGDLVGKLDRAGYHIETFKAAPPLSSGQSSNSSDPGQGRDTNGGHQQQQQEEAARQQLLSRQKRTDQAQWLQQLNGSFGSAPTEGIEKQ